MRVENWYKHSVERTATHLRRILNTKRKVSTMQTISTTINLTTSKKKQANGTGSIVQRTDKFRANPFMVRVWNGTKQVSIGSYPTYDLAYKRLTEYYTLRDLGINLTPAHTFKSVFDAAIEGKAGKVSVSTMANYHTSMRYCEQLHGTPINRVKILDLQHIINKLSASGIGKASQVKCKQLFSLILKQAIKMELLPNTVDWNSFIEVDKATEVKERTVFTQQQIKKLQELVTSSDPRAYMAKYVLMMCYCGVRPSEFINIKSEDVILNERYFKISKSKTAAGTNRIVPINRKTAKYFRELLKNKTEYLVIKPDKTPFTYHQFRDLFNGLMTSIGCTHTPHECRHTCATWLNNAGANDVCIKRILGHACGDLTKDVYTHKTTKDLIEAIDKI